MRFRYIQRIIPPRITELLILLLGLSEDKLKEFTRLFGRKHKNTNEQSLGVSMQDAAGRLGAPRFIY